jgi:hypothetical protein
MILARENQRSIAEQTKQLFTHLARETKEKSLRASLQRVQLHTINHVIKE